MARHELSFRGEDPRLPADTARCRRCGWVGVIEEWLDSDCPAAPCEPCHFGRHADCRGGHTDSAGERHACGCARCHPGPEDEAAREYAESGGR
jgi:hypothetical protein